MTKLRLRALLASAVIAALPVAGFAESFVSFDTATALHGPAASGDIVHFQIALRLRDAAGLDAVIAAHRVLTPAQLDAYMPDAAGHAAVLAWLRGQGLTVTTLPSRLAIRVAGPVALVSRALGVNFIHVTREGVDYVSADREPTVPAAIAAHIVGVNGLQPQLHAYPMLRYGGSPGIRPLAANGATPYYPSNLLTAYQANSLGTTGAGTTTAIIIDTFPYTADLTKFWSVTGVSQSLANITFIQTVSGTLAKPSGEESIDVEQSSSIAPSSQVRVYATYDLSFAHIDVGFQTVISDLQAGVPITQVSISLGACETGVSSSQKTSDDNYFATMTALGASVFVSSGDSGAKECGGRQLVPSFYSTSPNVAAVGGTTLNLTTSSTISSETAWSGSGGGISKFFATPSWQSGLGYAKRAVPDIASDANPNTGIYVVYAGKTGQFGGTSVSSPDWAGLMGLVNATRIAAGKATLGLIPSRTTSLVGTTNFRDITSGSNNGYSAKVGYDLVTGVGSPVMTNLFTTLVNQN